MCLFTNLRVISISSRNSSNFSSVVKWKLRIACATAIFIDIMAYLSPMQFLGPALLRKYKSSTVRRSSCQHPEEMDTKRAHLKGMKLYGCIFSQLSSRKWSGSNFLALGPHNFSSR